SRRPCWKPRYRVSEEAKTRDPIRGTFPDGCASTASGAASTVTAPARKVRRLVMGHRWHVSARTRFAHGVLLRVWAWDPRLPYHPQTPLLTAQSATPAPWTGTPPSARA